MGGKRKLDARAVIQEARARSDRDDNLGKKKKSKKRDQEDDAVAEDKGKRKRNDQEEFSRAGDQEGRPEDGGKNQKFEKKGKQQPATTRRNAEEDFPRGGKSILSAAEIEEAKAEAIAEFNQEAQDVQKAKKKKKNEEECLYSAAFFAGNAPKSVEPLKLKDLSSGMRVWGSITAINSRDLSISLPDGLHGFVKAEEAIPELSPESSQDKESIHSRLTQLFDVGQYVSCHVLDVEEVQRDGQGKRTRKAVLSLLPRHVNEGMTIENIYVGLLMIASVKSVEDHGYTLSFGLPGVSGFLLHKDHEGDTMSNGQIFSGYVSAVHMKLVVNLTTKKLQLSSTMKENDNILLSNFLPGALVKVEVQSVLRNGLLVSFLTYFMGTVDIFHLEDDLPTKEWTENYTKGKRFKARIIFIDPRTKSIRFTLRSHLVRAEIICPPVNKGDDIENAIIRRVDTNTGLLLELPTTPSVPGYVNKSDTSDKNVDKLEKKFKQGQKVRARVIGFRNMDRMTTLSLKESVLNSVTKLNLKVGMTVHGVVKKVEPVGAVVSLGEEVKAFCPIKHMSEYIRLKPSAKFEVGKKLTFRILQYDKQKKRPTLTYKKSLVSSKLPQITTYDDAVEGLVTHGWIQGINESIGCFVEFYNGVKGLARKSELGIDHSSSIADAFSVGQGIKCRVIKSDPNAQRIGLSFQISTRPEIKHDVKAGTIVSAFITEMDSLEIKLHANGNIPSTMSYEHLSDTPVHVEQLKALLKPGFKFDRLLVLGQKGSKVILTSKYSLIEAAEILPASVDELSLQAVLPGFISRIQDKACCVQFLENLTGVVPIRNASDGFVNDLSQAFFVGQSVRAQVLETDVEKEKFILSLKQSVCFSTNISLLEGYFKEEEVIAKLKEKDSVEWGNKLKIGEHVEADVQEVKEYGIILNIRGFEDIVGFATHDQTGGTIEVGAAVKASILDVVKVDGIVDLSLQKKMLENKKSTSALKLHERVQAVVELVKDEYLVLSLPDFGNAIAFASTRDFNIRMLRPHDYYNSGQKFWATVYSLSHESDGGRTLVLLADAYLSSSLPRIHAKNHVGSLVDGQVIEISPLHLIIEIRKNLRGKVHVTEVSDSFEEGNPLSKYKVGETVRARILTKHKTSRKHTDAAVFDLSLRLSGDPAARPVITFETVSSGQKVVAYVQEVAGDWAWLHLSQHLRGRLFILDSSDEPAELEAFKERLQVGNAVECYISSVDHEKKTVDLSFRSTEITKGDLRVGRIARVYPGVGGLSIQVGARSFGKVHVTHLGDTWTDNPGVLFTEGKFVKCRVLDIKETLNKKVSFDLSLRPSLGGCGGFESLLKHPAPERDLATRIIDSVSDLKIDMQVQGFVKTITNKGCFVILAPSVDAKILLKNLADSYVQSPAEMFPVGKVVAGRVLSVEPLSGRVEMTLAAAKDRKQLKMFNTGDIVPGSIRKIQKFGIFVSLAESDTVGLCHVSEVSDDFIEDLSTVYKAGQRVQVKILKIDSEKKRISLGMKASYLSESFRIAASDEAEPMDKETNEEHEQNELPSKTMDLDDEKDDYLDIDADVPATDMDVDPLEVNLDEEVAEAVASEDEKPATTKEVKKTKKEKKRLKEKREAAVRAAEERLLQQDQQPETEDDFERLVATSPNSSYVWIKYMAFWLRLADPDKARAVAERALERINYREETEKMNVWTAYLNLENSFAASPRDAVSALFERALRYCDPKKLHLQLLGVYESTKQHEMTDALMKSMTRKFRTSGKIWLRHLSNLLSRGLSEKALKAFDHAITALPRHKHVKFISAAAILEFKAGSPERARDIFDSVLRNYPKRTDLWSVYIDQEIRLGDLNFIRNLFERATCVDLSAKKMKFIFKKYLDFEKAQGDESQIEHVKKKAMEFVETKA